MAVYELMLVRSRVFPYVLIWIGFYVTSLHMQIKTRAKSSNLLPSILVLNTVVLSGFSLNTLNTLPTEIQILL